ncbi:MAG: polysaccharide deacetylase family protein [Pseudomonadota bacterium]
MHSLISIHDVMPDTLPQVRELLALLRKHGHERVTLLVVPGLAWSETALQELWAWQDAGLELAAHGWTHRAAHVRGVRHHMHAALISRQAAEHLALDTRGIRELMQAAADWFPRHGLQSPSTYVPPAWALGRMPRAGLVDMPFRQIEVMRGLLDTRSGRLQPMPLLGYQADTRLRAGFLALWNRLQVLRGRYRTHQPMRIGIHPDDAQLYLSAALERCLARVPPSILYMDHQRSRPN